MRLSRKKFDNQKKSQRRGRRLITKAAIRQYSQQTASSIPSVSECPKTPSKTPNPRRKRALLSVQNVSSIYKNVIILGCSSRSSDINLRSAAAQRNGKKQKQKALGASPRSNPREVTRASAPKAMTRKKPLLKRLLHRLYSNHPSA